MHTLVNSVWPNFSTTKLLTKVATKSLVTFSAISKNIIICKKYCFANIWLTFGNIWATFLLQYLITLDETDTKDITSVELKAISGTNVETNWYVIILFFCLTFKGYQNPAQFGLILPIFPTILSHLSGANSLY